MSIITTHPIGPVYVATEPRAPLPRLSTAWMHETEPPYRKGRAVRVRLPIPVLRYEWKGDDLRRRLGVEHLALHLGICRKTDSVTARPVERNVEEIREWRGPSST